VLISCLAKPGSVLKAREAGVLTSCLKGSVLTSGGVSRSVLNCFYSSLLIQYVNPKKEE
jgi:hypothetical protein